MESRSRAHYGICLLRCTEGACGVGHALLGFNGVGWGHALFCGDIWLPSFIQHDESLLWSHSGKLSKFAQTLALRLDLALISTRVAVRPAATYQHRR